MPFRWILMFLLASFAAGCSHDLDALAPPCGGQSECAAGTRCIAGRCQTTDAAVGADSAADGRIVKDAPGDRGPKPDQRPKPDAAPGPDKGPTPDGAMPDSSPGPDAGPPDTGPLTPDAPICPAGCWLVGKCLLSGTMNPKDSCQQCTPTTSGTQWSNIPGCFRRLTGMPGVTGWGGGNFNQAQFSSPRGIVVNTAGTVLHVADQQTSYIRKIDLVQEHVSTVVMFSTGVSFAAGMRADPAGKLVVALSGPSQIYEIDPASSYAKTLLVKAASGCTTGLKSPLGVYPDGTNVFIADTLHHTIRYFSIGSLGTVAGTCLTAGYDNANPGKFNKPGDLILYKTGELLVADTYNFCVRRIKISPQNISTFAGVCGTQGSKDGTATGSQPSLRGGFSWINSLALGPGGKVFVGGGNRISEIDEKANTIKTVAQGTGGCSAAGSLDTISGMVYDANSKRLFFTEQKCHTVDAVYF